MQLAQQDRLVQLVLKEIRGHPALQVQLVLLAQRVHRVHLALLVHRVIKDLQVLQELRAPLALPEKPVHKEFKDRPVLPELRVQLVLRVKQVHRVFKEVRVLLELPVPRDHKAHRE